MDSCIPETSPIDPDINTLVESMPRAMQNTSPLSCEVIRSKATIGSEMSWLNSNNPLILRLEYFETALDHAQLNILLEVSFKIWRVAQKLLHGLCVADANVRGQKISGSSRPLPRSCSSTSLGECRLWPQCSARDVNGSYSWTSVII